MSARLLEIEETTGALLVTTSFPSIVRDVSLLIDRKVTVADLLRAAREEKAEHFVDAHFVGTYEGEGIPIASGPLRCDSSTAPTNALCAMKKWKRFIGHSWKASKQNSTPRCG